MKLIEFLIYLLIFIFPLGQFSRIPIAFSGFPEIRIYYLDLTVFLIFLSWTAWHLSSKKAVRWPPFFNNLAIIYGILLVSVILNFLSFKLEEIIIGFSYFSRFFFYSFLSLILFDLHKNKFKINRSSISPFFSWTGLVLAILGLMQYLLIPDTRFLASLGWDLHYYRVIGPILDPNFMGILLTLPILAVLSEFLNQRRISFKKLALLCLIVTSFLLTYSRSSYLALIAGVMALFVLNKKAKLIFFFLIIFFISIFLLPRPGGEGVKLERTASILQRSESWQTAVEIWRRSPLFGVGFNNYRYQLHRLGFLPQNDWRESHAASGVENSFLLILATSGVLGLAAFVWFLLKYFQTLLTMRKSPVFVFTFSGLVSILIHCLFINSFFYPWVMIYFWTILALGVMD
jgi:O-antigen ligase